MRALSIASFCCVCALLPRGAAALTYTAVESFAVPTNATMMVYSPTMEALVLKNSASAIVAIDLETRQATMRLANTNFTDMSPSPSGRYVFAADYGGENIGLGNPAATHYIHRLDLTTMAWDSRTAYIAGHVQAVSDTQVILKSLDQWITFTNNAWGSGTALNILSTPNVPYYAPGYYASVYTGNFRYDVSTSRLLHGDSGSSSQEIQAFRIVNNEFVEQEGSGIYGSAQGYGGSWVLATDGSAFYYGALQVDPLDVRHNLRVFPELIHAANGSIALGNGKYYDVHTGAFRGSLPFATTVYAMNPSGDDFWAFDPATTTVHHFVASAASTNVALAANGGVATSSSNFSSGTTPPGAINGDRKGLGWNAGGGWKSAAGMPQWLQVQFAGQRTIDRVIVYDVQDNFLSPVEPTDSMTNPLYGSSFVNFTVEMWNGVDWLAVATVAGNNLVKRAVTFPAVTTDRIRVRVTASADSYARFSEVEVFTAAPAGPAPSSTTVTSSANPGYVGNFWFTATVTGTNPTGNVAFTDGGQTIYGCAATPLTGSGHARTASCPLSISTAGTRSIVASYAGDPANAPSVSSTLSQIVNPRTFATATLASSANPSVAGAVVTFTATVTGTSPTGNVRFTESFVSIAGCGAAPLTGSGNTRTATCSLVLPVGSHSIGAEYVGDAGNHSDHSNTVVQVVNAGPGASTTTTLASSANPSLAGATVTFTATVTGANPSGSVSFTANGDSIAGCTGLPFTGGSGNVRTAACSIALAAGTHFMVAAYSGDAANAASASSALSQLVTLPMPSSTSIVSSANPSSTGSAVTFTASVIGNNPTGSVSFTDNGNAIAGCTSLPFSPVSGSIRTTTCSTALATGAHPIVATYSGDAANIASSSSTLSQVVVQRTASSTTLTSPVNSSFAGAVVAFSAAVSGNNPTGRVYFVDDAHNIVCFPFVTGSGNTRTAPCLVSWTTVGTHTIVANYGGDVANFDSSSSALTHAVLPAGPNVTTTGLASSANPSTAGVGVTLTATVNGPSPTGTIDIYDADNPVTGCSALPLTGSGNTRTATCVTPALDAGDHFFLAAYTGDAANAPSFGYAPAQQVIPAPNPTSTGLTSSANPSVAGAIVTLTATVTGITNPFGSVSFTNGGNPVSNCTGVPFTGGSGNIWTTTCSTVLTAGTHSIVATYSGDGFNAASTSNALSQVVNPAAPAPTLTVLTGSPDPAILGATITFTATVSGNSPTGTVTFDASGNLLCAAVALTGNSNVRTATCSVSSFAVGPHSVYAGYSGDLANQTSYGSTTVHVLPVPTTTTLASSPNPSFAGSPVTLTATVTGTDPSGSVLFTRGGVQINSCMFLTLTGSGNVRTATCTTTALGVGTHAIVASYVGDTNNAASASGALSQVVNAGGGTINVALAANGGVATSSSNHSSGTQPPGAINGDRKGSNWNFGGGWKSAAGMPQWLEVQFAGSRVVDRVVLYDAQDDFLNPVEPTDTMTNPLYGSSFIDFTVSGWDGGNWVVLATVSGNNLVKRTVTFPPYTTNRVRVTVTRSADAYARLTEIEVWGQ